MRRCCSSISVSTACYGVVLCGGYGRWVGRGEVQRGSLPPAGARLSRVRAWLGLQEAVGKASRLSMQSVAWSPLAREITPLGQNDSQRGIEGDGRTGDKDMNITHVSPTSLSTLEEPRVQGHLGN